MKKQEEKKIVNLDQFDQTVSLFQLLPSGTGKGLKKLKILTDSIINSQVEESRKPLNLLIAGKQGTLTHARSFLRAIGLDYPLEMPSKLVQATFSEVYQFFSPSRMCDSHIIDEISILYPSVLKALYEIITTGQHSIHNTTQKTTEVVPVMKPLIMTTHMLEKVPLFFQEKVDYLVELEDYTSQQLELIVLQRIKYCQIDYEEEVLKLIVESGSECLDNIIRMLKDSITVMLSDGRNTLTIDDVGQAKEWL